MSVVLWLTKTLCFSKFGTLYCLSVCQSISLLDCCTIINSWLLDFLKTADFVPRNKYYPISNNSGICQTRFSAEHRVLLQSV